MAECHDLAPSWLGKGHVCPLSYPVFQHALREAGFAVETIATNRSLLESPPPRGGARSIVRLGMLVTAPVVRRATARQSPDDPIGRPIYQPDASR